MKDDNGRDVFLRAVRSALDRMQDTAPVTPPGVPLFPRDTASVEQRAWAVARKARDKANELFVELQKTASEAGWIVNSCADHEQAAQYIVSLARSIKARTILRSAHQVLDRLHLEGILADTGIDLRVMAINESGTDTDIQRTSLRERVIQADMGITGVDHAIAETGSCVILASKGVSRLVSLLPPVHVAVVMKGQVLPGLDELFTLRRQDLLTGEIGGYMNIITGPSRSADIEQTIVVGVHGPGKVHLVMVG